MMAINGVNDGEIQQLAQDPRISKLESTRVALLAKNDALRKENETLYALAENAVTEEWVDDNYHAFVVGDEKTPHTSTEQLCRIKILALIFGLENGRAESLYFTTAVSARVADYLLVQYGEVMWGALANNLHRRKRNLSPVIHSRVRTFFSKFPEKRKMQVRRKSSPN